ncbi:patatin [Parapusillimonas sp. SGNA-6]|uniref:patatin-like phospholipase family protein n=1 Tax=Parapedobacter sp. SGR-10 TaxID=2710879 RepID=UPI0013D399F6|nr:patatin-like phospholipase family protein [Parapedobacter sp. SGR-10]NGF57414.1 patatin [Parapedobacter sp. SGR-10]NGM90826.1 patatin [Parapusillimonas sp. SGNA-6]
MKSNKLSLVLGSGGARGIAHIGVIRFLIECGYEIDEVVGCSIGSLVGGAFAKGKIFELEEWMSRLTKREVFRLMDFSDPRFGFLKGERVFNTLQDVFEDEMIENLGVSYTAVATDLAHDKEIVFRQGSLYKAIRASIAIPAVFKGVDTEDSFLVDGGVLNPLPVNHVQHRDNIVVAVNLDGYPEMQAARPYSRMNAIGILQESYLMMRRRLATLTVNLYRPDYIIDIPHNIANIWDFDRSTDLIERGYTIAKSNFSELVLTKSV